MKKLICLLLVMTLLAACGAKPKEQAVTTAAPTEPPMTAPTAQIGEETVEFQPWEGEGVPSQGTWYLTKDVVLTAPVTVEGALRLHLNGHTVTGDTGCTYGSFFTVPAGAEMVLFDEADAEGKLLSIASYGKEAPLRHMIWVEGKLTLAGGTVDASQISLEDTENGPCIYVAGGGQFDMIGGTLVGGTCWTTSLVLKPEEPVEGEIVEELPQETEQEEEAPAYWQHSQEEAGILGKGGSIYVEAGSVCTIWDGRITAGSAGLGGNLYIEGGPEEPGKVTIHGGRIEEGESVFHGGNIYCAGSLEITAGELVSGKAYANGGNIFLSGTLKMTGGSLIGGRCDYGSQAGKRGANLLVNGKYAQVEISNAQIIDGDGHGGENFGGNICVMGQCAREFSVTDTTISGGQGHRGGNLYFGTLAKDVEMENLDFYMKNVTVAGGTCSYKGANLCMDSDLRGIYVNLVMDNCVITTNGGTSETISLGAGAAIDTWATLTMNGGSIDGGTLTLYKDAVLTGNGTAMTMDTFGGQGEMIQNP